MSSANLNHNWYYLAFKEMVKSTAGPWVYDSTRPKTATDNLLAPMYSAMIGQSFVMKVTPEGKIVELKGIDEMYLRIAERIVENEDESVRKRIMWYSNGQFELSISY